MTSEVTNDLIFGVSGVINPCSSAFLAPKCFSELIVPEEGQISSINLLAAPQVKRPLGDHVHIKSTLRGEGG